MSVLADPEAEKAVLGAVIVNNGLMAQIEGSLRPEHFSLASHRTIYAAMLVLAQSGHPIDFVTLRDELTAGGMLSEAGGVEYISRLDDGMPRVENAEHWSGIVREKARRRAALALGERLASEARVDASETDELLDRHQAALMRLLDSGDNGIKHIGSVLPAAIKDLEEFGAAPGGMTGVPTGFPDFDKLTSGLKGGVLFVLGARPSRGKSTFCAQVAVEAARKGHKVLLFAMEMPPEQVAQRMLLTSAEIEKWDLRRNAGKDVAWRKVIKAYGELDPLPLYFDGREGPTLAQIRASARIHQSRTGLDLVIVDYLQRVSVDPKQERWLAIGDVARGLKNLAMSLKVPVIAASQLDATAEEKRPTMANLQQAQSIISAEADIIAFLHPEEPDKWKEQPFPVINLLVDKHRAGATLAIPLSFEKATTRFVNLARVPM
jgi:replicative DNA helicase